MKRIIATLCSLTTLLTAAAQLDGDGYYRVQNYLTGRYAYVYDNKGSINMSSTSIDAGAIQLWTGFERTLYDAASVLYITKVGSQYDITAQNTGIYQMIETYVSIRHDNRIPGTYWAYGSKGGMTKYLADTQDNPDMERGFFDEGVGEARNWYILPISSASDNFFGVKPAVQASGVYYGTLFADFPFSFASAGMQALYVCKVDKHKGIAVYREIPAPVAPSVPVIIRCAGASCGDNRLDLGGENPNSVNDNMLRGVYFNSDVYRHVNHVPYNSSTMRSLGLTSTGRLGLVAASYDYVPANSFYLPVDADCPAELVLMSETEYESGITDVLGDSDCAPADIYNLQGVRVRRAADSLQGLAPGVYITCGRKVSVR